ncbi:MAG: neutral/alkaline non-lysosomal ceramidase N-terminal domain-containing protein [Bacteroidales bacterium]|nr:neutral/alkaline non-lysosomal ceramidase N-terminal domain-containing protein [Bacteroidales bacterium]
MWIFWNLRDRHHGYEVDLNLRGAEAPGAIKVGFAALPITPEIVDTWNDINGDAKFREKEGDTYNDNNNNGKFDAYWIAGFSNQRAANGVHDDVWARVVVFDDGQTRLALVSLDAIGFRHDDVVDIRKQIPEQAGIDYAIISSTHTHESNDLIGIWGESPLKSGVNQDNMQFIKNQVVEAISQAADNLRPAKLLFSQDLTGAEALVMDTRDPIVMDPGLRMLQAIDAETDATLGTLVAWANHPETLWSDNLYISSDFPHYVRDGLEKGVYDGDTLIKPGVGGISVYINGAIGGLMTTRASMPLDDPFLDTTYTEASFNKAKAQGDRLAMLALNAMENPDTVVQHANLSVRAKTIELPLDNRNFRLAAMFGILDFGMTGWFKIRTEIAAFTLGPASFLCVPGEIYPELVNGGVEAPEGQDYQIAPVEDPPLRHLMPGTYRFVIGLSNDEIGYILPKSQWDVEAPYTYEDDEAPYGEENSIGPETAPLLYDEFTKILTTLMYDLN